MFWNPDYLLAEVRRKKLKVNARLRDRKSSAKNNKTRMKMVFSA